MTLDDATIYSIRAVAAAAKPARKELQRLAKLCGIKANQKNTVILEELEKLVAAAPAPQPEPEPASAEVRSEVSDLTDNTPAPVAASAPVRQAPVVAQFDPGVRCLPRRRGASMASGPRTHPHTFTTQGAGDEAQVQEARRPGRRRGRDLQDRHHGCRVWQLQVRQAQGRPYWAGPQMPALLDRGGGEMS